MNKRTVECCLTSSQGMKVRVYRLTPGDAEHLIDLFAHMSPASRQFRFNEYLDHPDPEYVRREAARLANVTPEQGAAWLAFADLPDQPDAPVAGARYVRTEDPAVAEISAAVRDDLQQRGIGSELLFRLAERAKADGIHRLVASFHTGNKAIWSLLAESPFHVTTEVHGTETEVIIDLERPAAAEPAVPEELEPMAAR